MMIRLGTLLSSSAATGEGPTGAFLRISASSVAEDATSGTAIGVLSVTNGSGVYTFTITADPDTKFAINVDGVTLETAAALDYETATTHSVTIQADNGVDPILERTFTIYVTNVYEEPNLVALTLSASTIEEASAEDTVVGAIVGQTAGSTLSLTGTAGNRFKISAGNVVAGPAATDYATSTTHDITIRETLADSANSPLNTTITITVTQAAVGPVGDGIQLETGDFLLAENGDYLIQEAA